MNITVLEDRSNPAAITTTTLSPAIEGTGLGIGTPGSLRVSTDTPSSLPIIVTLGYSGSGTNGTDYNASTFATIPAFASYVDVAINPVHNSKATGTLSVVATVQSGFGYTVGSPSASTTNLYDADNPQISVAQQGTDPTEGGNGAFRISRTGSRAATSR